MVHNGIEYGLMQSYAEGFEVLHNLESLAGWVDDSGEGRTLDAGDYSARMVAALRNQFGGHAVKTAPKT